MGNNNTKTGATTPPITIATIKTHAKNALNFVSNLADHIEDTLPRTSIEQKEIQNLWSIYHKQQTNINAINTNLHQNFQIVQNSIRNIQQETWLESKLEYMHGTDLNHNRNQPFVRNRRGSNISNTSNTTPVNDQINMDYMINIKPDEMIEDTSALNTIPSTNIEDNYSHDGLFEFALDDDSNVNIENTSFNSDNKCKEVISEFKFDFITKYKSLSMLFTIHTQFMNGNCMYFYNQKNWRTSVMINNLHFIFCEYLFAIHDNYGMFDDMPIIVKRKSILKSSVVVNQKSAIRFCISLIVDYLLISDNVLISDVLICDDDYSKLMVVYDNEVFVEGNDAIVDEIGDISMFEWNSKSMNIISQLLMMLNESESDDEYGEECDYSLKEFMESVLGWFLSKNMIQYRRENVDKQITWIEDI